MPSYHSELRQLATAVDDFIRSRFALICDIHSLKSAESTDSNRNTWLEDSRSHLKRLGTRVPAKVGHGFDAAGLKLRKQANACQEPAGSLIHQLDESTSVQELPKIINSLRKSLPGIDDEMFEISEALDDGTKN